MLTIAARPRSPHSLDPLSRRDFLRVGSLSLGAFSLADLLVFREASAATTSDWLRDRSVVLLYLSGGASHIETFDPKPEAPVGVRSVTGKVATPLAGVTFGGTFPQLAARADRLTVVRSFHLTVGDHVRAHRHVLSGGLDRNGGGEEGFSLAACATRLRGANHPATGLPTNVLLTEREIDGQYNRELGRIRSGSRPGELGPAFAPFEHQSGWESEARRDTRKETNPLRDAMTLTLPEQRFTDRRTLLAQLDRINREIDSGRKLEGVDRAHQQAVNLVLGGAAEAFDVSSESPRTISQYDTSRMRIGHKVFRPSTLGRQMLIARRLVEQGVGFVTVHSAGWDMHADRNNPGIVTGMEMLGRSLDSAVSAFLDDLRTRNMEREVLLVITGDFGRTPRVNKNGGRDHWARLGTLAFAGGDLPSGVIVGSSDRHGGEPASHPVSIDMLRSTVLHSLFDVGQMRLDSSVPRTILQGAQAAEPLQAMLS